MRKLSTLLPMVMLVVGLFSSFGGIRPAEAQTLLGNCATSLSVQLNSPTSSNPVFCSPVTVAALVGNCPIGSTVDVQMSTGNVYCVPPTVVTPPLTTVFNCPAFTSTGSCGTSLIGSGGQPFAIVGSQSGSNPSLSGSQVNLIPTGATHAAISMNYQTLVNVQGFSSTFTFVPNGQNIAFVLQNSNNNPTFNGKSFSAGAGCEAGFFQAFSQAAPPNNVFALELDSYSPLTENGSFVYSSAQYYTPGVHASNAPNPPGQSPCNPNQGGTDFTYASVTKVSTSPVNLTSGNQNTTTGHTYSATVTYDGSNLTLNLFDVTLNGACPGSACFTYMWTGVNIPSIVGGSTAWLGLMGATGLSAISPLYINSFSYATGNPTPPFVSATWDISKNPNGYITLSNGNDTATATDSYKGATIFSTLGAASGSGKKYYFEVVVNAPSGRGGSVGLANAAYANYSMGSDSNAIADNIGGGIEYNNMYQGFSQIQNGDTIGVAFDTGANTVMFQQNNGSWSTPISISGITGTLYPAINLQGAGDSMIAHFAQTSWTFAPPSGFTEVGK